jgi:hypothetical protein
LAFGCFKSENNIAAEIILSMLTDGGGDCFHLRWWWWVVVGGGVSVIELLERSSTGSKLSPFSFF